LYKKAKHLMRIVQGKEADRARRGEAFVRIVQANLVKMGGEMGAQS
jgi:hypothetical protein